jgi:hypothetical protein
MNKDLIKKVNKAKNCFVWILLNRDGGEYIYVSKKEVKHIINTTICEIELDRYVLRESGDLYIN